jgi:hypothetical protein
LRIDDRAAADNVNLKPGGAYSASIDARDPDGDSLTFRWDIMPEVGRGGYAGMGERPSKSMPELIKAAGAGKLAFAAPKTTGAYRLFVAVSDGAGNAAAANIPFFVQPSN